MHLHVDWAADSDVGRQRDHNEDSFLADEEGGLWVVADGMGGHNSGEEASQIAIVSMHEYLIDRRGDPEILGRLGSIQGLPRAAADMVTAVRYANERIFIEALRESGKQGMGTTVVGVFREGNTFVVGSVGDSRIYRFRGNVLEQITVVHSLLNHLIGSKGITREEAEMHARGKGNIIVRALGMKDTVNVDVRMEPMAENDIYLLCSDGLTDMVDDHTIGKTLAESGQMPAQAVERLIRTANANGGADNVSVCVLRIIVAP